MPLLHSEYLEFLKVIMPLFYYAGVYEGILKEDADYNAFLELQNFEVLKECKDALFNEPSLFDSFLADNKHLLKNNSINIIQNLKRFVKSEFIVYEYCQDYFIAIDLNTSEVYEVRDLTDPFPTLVPGFPVYVKTTIMPFKNIVIFDGFLEIMGVPNNEDNDDIILECEKILANKKIKKHY